jgi:hypothetical protein
MLSFTCTVHIHEIRIGAEADVEACPNYRRLGFPEAGCREAQFVQARALVNILEKGRRYPRFIFGEAKCVK